MTIIQSHLAQWHHPAEVPADRFSQKGTRRLRCSVRAPRRSVGSPAPARVPRNRTGDRRKPKTVATWRKRTSVEGAMTKQPNPPYRQPLCRLTGKPTIAMSKERPRPDSDAMLIPWPSRTEQVVPGSGTDKLFRNALQDIVLSHLRRFAPAFASDANPVPTLAEKCSSNWSRYSERPTRNTAVTL